MYDPTPGSLDGPPAEEKQSVAEKFGIVLAIALVLTLAGLVFSGAWWAIMWLWANMP